MTKTYEEINERIRSGKAVVMTAEEVVDVVRKKGALVNLFRTHPTTEDRIEKLRKLDAEINGGFRY